MKSTRPARADSRAIPAVAGGAVIREVRDVQGPGPLSGPSALPSGFALSASGAANCGHPLRILKGLVVERRRKSLFVKKRQTAEQVESPLSRIGLEPDD